MPTLNLDYQSFRKHLVDYPINRNELENLILEFQPEINSKRRSGYINSLEGLVRLLEKRGYISENKIDGFANRVRGSVPAMNINGMLSRYQSRPTSQFVNSNVNLAFTNLYSRSTAVPPPYSRQCSDRPTSMTSSSTVTADMYCELPRNVIDRVVRDIGTDWKDLARELGIREGEIDEIECKYLRSYSDRARECLKSFIKETDPYKLQHKLLGALIKCGRKDLHEAVQELLSRRPY